MAETKKRQPSKSDRPCIRIEPDVHRMLCAVRDAEGVGIGWLANRLIRDGLRDRLRRSAS